MCLVCRRVQCSSLCTFSDHLVLWEGERASGPWKSLFPSCTRTLVKLSAANQAAHSPVWVPENHDSTRWPWQASISDISEALDTPQNTACACVIARAPGVSLCLSRARPRHSSWRVAALFLYESPEDPIKPWSTCASQLHNATPHLVLNYGRK